jgi:uncharacterized protein (DUF488 family)
MMLTIGHGTRSEEELGSLLSSFGVELLVDVRGKWPRSRHNPQSNKENISIWLPKDFGIKYQHIPLLGGWQPKQNVDANINAGWRVNGMKNYADYTLSTDFMVGLEILETLNGTYSLAYMCAETVPWRCHRLLLSNVLVARGHTVFHILSEGHLIEHELGKWGAKPKLSRTNEVTYPRECDD